MYGIFPYIWLIFGGYVRKYTIHGCYGLIGIKSRPVISLFSALYGSLFEKKLRKSRKFTSQIHFDYTPVN